MAYDETQAQWVRGGMETVADGHDVQARRMFGGLAFMVNGHMCCCVDERGLLVRVGPDAYEYALAQPGTRVMDLTGKVMKGMVYVDFDIVGDRAALDAWIGRGLEFVCTLPPKPARKARSR